MVFKLTEIAKLKLKRRLALLLLLSVGFATYCIFDIYMYYVYNRYEDFFKWLIYNVIAINLNLTPVQYYATFPTLSLIFLLCILTCAVYSIIRTSQAEKMLEKYEKEGVGHPVLQLLRVGLFKEAVEYYFKEGRSYECANFLYGALSRNPDLLRQIWQIISSRLDGLALLEEAEKLLLVLEDAPREIKLQVRDMLIENGVYEVGSPEEIEWLEKALLEEAEKEKCMICGKKISGKPLTCPFCFGKACESHLNYFDKKDKCPSCGRPIKKYLLEWLTKNGADA